MELSSPLESWSRIVLNRQSPKGEIGTYKSRSFFFFFKIFFLKMEREGEMFCLRVHSPVVSPGQIR